MLNFIWDRCHIKMAIWWMIFLKRNKKFISYKGKNSIHRRAAPYTHLLLQIHQFGNKFISIWQMCEFIGTRKNCLNWIEPFFEIWLSSSRYCGVIWFPFIDRHIELTYYYGVLPTNLKFYLSTKCMHHFRSLRPSLLSSDFTLSLSLPLCVRLFNFLIHFLWHTLLFFKKCEQIIEIYVWSMKWVSERKRNVSSIKLGGLTLWNVNVSSSFCNQTVEVVY